ncbi:D-alanine--D-alanine ligase [Lactovum miscens]|uniref:D-alanine--D-alanine ligase n=1 Tax=Lactovum miscens TaxID=190387 RepID=A0A841C6K3_9LACT|nr:D-alanine--D-alanine ligase [Lactovum miscens]MBB5887232.1 D-alanine-D-alanine ligase [Lactovum miscens]
MKQKLIVLYGGRSAEKEVSVLSAKNVISATNKEKFEIIPYFISDNGDFYRVTDLSELMTNQTRDENFKIMPGDIYEDKAVVLPILHGPMGEDGTIQGFLEILHMPYVGPSVLSASSTMDKLLAKLVFTSLNIPQVPYVTALAGENEWQIIEEVAAKLKFPVFVKPSNMGSSVGISKAENVAELNLALTEAFKFDSRVVVEQGVVNAREIECAVLGNGNEVKAAFPGEVIKDVDFYDYKSKYLDNRIEMAIPADISEKLVHQIRTYAIKAYKAVNGTGMSRCDFFLDNENHLYLNEINSIPGFTQWSMYPLLWDNMGLKYPELIEKLVELAQSAFIIRESHLGN